MGRKAGQRSQQGPLEIEEYFLSADQLTSGTSDSCVVYVRSVTNDPRSARQLHFQSVDNDPKCCTFCPTLLYIGFFTLQALEGMKSYTFIRMIEYKL